MQVKAKKHLGQNFLQDKNIINKIVYSANIKNEEVIEIGPGQGAITGVILEDAKHLFSYEIDSDMITILNDKFSSKDNFSLFYEDFLKADLTKYSKKMILVANIPYYITSDILFKVFEYKHLFKRAIIMMQKEVAQRIVAKPNSNDYSKLSVVSQFISEPKILFDVSPSCFIPAPKVWSSVIEFNFTKETQQNKDFFDFVKLCFMFRRKKLFNNLIQKFSKNKILSVFETLGLNESIRSQELSVNQFILLFEEFQK
ncbi:16S rRNA (adenine(1518)-N(6)/adenine(1519)-N(6))-dimethyltransferase RsmA [[Mycoplasma] gypis]|uniref:Ribosomal RNA small subunit methyltransferase A n=1 Tax=[Mycoplasma] gypis TaxID=92404 RepID=A0ABZ2RTC0_9BACT|nr:16S rRNA (adenine(1518)-N(6)/adenine(1519)-N(6))-dimethyltransferase RsmA [[Mycoplasma] gypis]MBN0919517.1 16S rRNA (adenine(1518)-N(6)/adenine(1519)-N(6))-dimethyltransferase RsmA [[Mycoplasma] gypis]